MRSRQKRHINLKLHPKQAEVFRSPARFRVLAAGRRFGKTRMSVVEMIRAAKHPNRKVWYVCPTYRMARDVVWEMLTSTLPKRWIKKKHDTRMELQLINGTLLACRGADTPDSLRGVGLDFLVIDEVQDIDPNAWYTVLRPTLADTGGRALFIGSPKGFQLLYDLYKNGQNPEMSDWESWQFRTADSPFVPDEEIEQARRDMDERQFRQEFLADFVSMAGRVYHPFNHQEHIGDYPFNPELPIWVGQDFNINPMAAAIMQPQPNGEVWVVDEIVRNDSNTLDACNALESRYWRWVDDISIFPDPSGGSRQHARGESDLDVFRERGFVNIYHHNRTPPVADRVNAVNRMLKNAKGEVRLKVNSTCRQSILSFDQVQYRDDSRQIDKRANIEHITDAVGYPIHYLFPTKKKMLIGASLDGL